jgi:hypothetical protein
MVPIDASRPIGPGNIRWALPADAAFSTRDGIVAYNRAHREANRDHHRNKQLRKDYGVDIAYERQMFGKQNGLCAICKQPEAITRGHKTRRLSVDHDHTTGVVRGLLCGNCNLGLGYFCDSSGNLRNAIAYLDRYMAEASASEHTILENQGEVQINPGQGESETRTTQ